MPAVLNDAFRSPFDRLSGQGGKQQTSDTISTGDIRNPDRQNLDFGQSGISGGPEQPFQQNYSIGSHSQAQAQAHAQDQAQAHMPVAAPNGINWGIPVHNCERLIAEMMACHVCRQTLQGLLTTWSQQTQAIQEPKAQAQAPAQIGGGFGLGLSSHVITNIIIGVAVIFLLDRIIQIRLG